MDVLDGSKIDEISFRGVMVRAEWKQYMINEEVLLDILKDFVFQINGVELIKPDNKKEYQGG